ncbi:CHAT domain-containing tetratricopeptide repeat protein [Nostoc sp. FACHB-190]|uniref:CHAT domain-containing protein n=1 Tax=Nostoc sp. FACHB-190 TaxID=2692838 RepID=UPI001683996B|nr:CHAT domain-containing tetratricopeptide repeat protein [Nostoc sp. FACHB-190]MBD2299737.1 CHAT domain-containing protein [Nostoc sp. FACHB-190]
MNEQRQQAYLNLIQTLLNCPSGEEPGILTANKELLDAGFVQVVAAVAEHFAQQGEENTANWLRNLTAYLTSETPAITEADIETYEEFILEVLQATAESNGDPQVIHPLLDANTDKLNLIFAELLRRWATNTLAEAEPDTAVNIALLINKLSNRISDFPLGSKANNIEIAITGYETTLNLYTRRAFPEQWAATQNNLGIAYSYRILGERAKNIEKAIAAYTMALEVRTRKTFPEKWAATQSNLGVAYSYRILGDRADNIELAIAAYTAALEIYTRRAFPEKWAGTQSNLGSAYSYRILGENSENLELAIAAHSAALEVYTRSAFPVDWAGTQNNLGEAYRNRILGKETENLEKAIAAYTAALEVYTHSTFPEQWATTQNNLGAAYSQRVSEEQAENIEKAIAAYRAALEVYTRTAFPDEWATMQNNLGVAYRNRILGNRAENIKNVVSAYTAALQVHTRITFPQYHAETLLNLGRLYQEEKQFDSAYNTFTQAIETIETLRQVIISGGEAKRKQAEEWNTLYRRMMEVCLALKKDTAAIEYVERSKTRNLVELILERDSKTIFPPEVFTQLEQLRDEIASKQYQLQNGKAENPTALAQHLQKLRQQRNNLQDKYLPVGSSFKFDQFQETLDANTAIIEWYIASDKILAFIIKPHGQKLTVWQSQPEDLAAFINWVNEYLGDYYRQKDKWRNQLEERLQELANILNIEEILNLAQIPKNYKLILIPHRSLHLLPLHALPVGESCLIDLFPNGVSYAPSCQLLQQVQQRKRPDFQSLFAIQNPTGDLNYTDLEVQVIQSYFNTANVLKRTDATLTTINNSDLNTYHCAHFSCHGFFNLTNAGKSALILANSPVTDTPTKPDSERYLNVRAGETHDLEKCLTLDKIFALKLEKCRLVTLSACETGLIDFDNSSDEYIGLPSGFLLAGSQAVVSSLWKVDDLSTAFLMMKFYENLQTLNSVSLALNQAQQWLRNLTTEEFEALLVKYDSQIEEIFAQLPEEKRLVARAILRRMCRRKPHPFAAPFYWAGFTATGL